MRGLDLRATAADTRFMVPNLAGLVVAMASALLILLYIINERSYERWLPGSENVAIVSARTAMAEGSIEASSNAPLPLAATLVGRVSGVKRLARVVEYEVDVVRDAESDRAVVSFVDAAFPKLIGLSSVLGDPTAALALPGSMVIDRTTAKDWFGTPEAAVGRTMRFRIDGAVAPYVIRAVVEDAAGLTHLRPSILMPLSTLPEGGDTSLTAWLSLSGRTYVELSPGVDRESVEATINRLSSEAMAARLRGSQLTADTDINYVLVPIRDIRLGAPELSSDFADRLGDPEFVRLLTAFCLLTLTLAIFNFATLAAVTAGRRSHEIALKRFMGMTPKELALQTWSENAWLAGLATLFGCTLAIVLLPLVNASLALSLKLSVVAQPLTLALIFATWLLIALSGALAAGAVNMSVPAALLLRGGAAVSRSRGATLRFGVVSLQYTVAVFLGTLALTMAAQQARIRSIDPGFQTANLYVFDLKSVFDPGRVSNFSARASRLDGFLDAAIGSAGPGEGSRMIVPVALPGGVPVAMDRQAVSSQWFNVFNTPLRAGTDFTSMETRAPNDTTRTTSDITREQSVIVNEAAATALGMNSPSEAVGQVLRDYAGPAPLRIVGVVADQRFLGGSIAARPIVYTQGSTGGLLAIRFAPSSRVTQEDLYSFWQADLADVPVALSTADVALEKVYASDTQRLRTLTGFSALAIAIATLGAYSLSAYNARRQAREMAIRRLSGASRGVVAWLHIRRSAQPAMVGAAIAMPFAWVTAEAWLAESVDRISNPLPYAFVALAIAIFVALLAAALEAWNIAMSRPVAWLQSN